MSPATTEIAAPAIEESINLQPGSTPDIVATSHTFTADFAKERHRLSGRPLRRPDRRLPISTPVVPMRAEEDAARKALQRRMPSREKLQAMADRRPRPDPWLDDKYDWRP